jgi:uncharacterized protein YbjT (DUF2867 family)
MAKRLLIAGASGSIGYAALRLAKEHGMWVRAYSRNQANYGRLSLHADDIVFGDATAGLGLDLIVDGVDTVLSCLGASVNPSHSQEKRSFYHVDVKANRNLLAAAQQIGTPEFVYVSAHLAPGYTHTAYIQAHEKIVDLLQLSKLKIGIIRPTGIFATFLELLAYARYGFLPVIGDGTARTNPVHEADVALACIQSVMDGPRSIDIGGPEIFSRRELAELMFRVTGREPRLIPLAPRVFQFMAFAAGIGSPRMRELYEFAGEVSVHNSIAPPVGTHRLEDYLRETVKAARRG